MKSKSIDSNEEKTWVNLINTFLNSTNENEIIDVGYRLSWYYPSVSNELQSALKDRIAKIDDKTIVKIVGVINNLLENNSEHVAQLITDLLSYCPDISNRIKNLLTEQKVLASQGDAIQQFIDYLITTSTFKYDVALSFAGEERRYVETIAEILNAMGLKVFYDRYEEVDIWGKNLYTHLFDIYNKESKYCVMFISKNYKNKVWTNHERESAQAKALIEKHEYILPVRFDNVEIPGLNPTIKYLKASDYSPEELAKIIVKKIKPNVMVDDLLTYLKEWLGDDYQIYQRGINIVFKCPAEDFYGEFPLRLLLEMYKLDKIDEMFLLPAIVPN